MLSWCKIWLKSGGVCWCRDGVALRLILTLGSYPTGMFFNTNNTHINTTSLVCVFLCLGPKCYHVLNWFFLPKPGFLKIYLNFQQQKSLLNQYLPHSKSKSYQINSIKSCSSRSFQTTPKADSPFLPNFQLQFNFISFSVKKSFNIQRTFAVQVQTSWNRAHAPQAHAPLLVVVESFPKTPRTRSEASQFSESHYYKKQNKLPSFIDRYT